MSNPFENERAQPKEHFGSIQTFANALEQASNYGPSQPLPSEARPGRYRIALTQGLIFGVILAVTVFLLSHQLLVTTQGPGSQAAGDLEDLHDHIFFLVMTFCYFCSSLRTVQRTRSMGVGLIASVSVTLCLFASLLIITPDAPLPSLALSTAFCGVIGLGISAMGGQLARSRAKHTVALTQGLIFGVIVLVTTFLLGRLIPSQSISDPLSFFLSFIVLFLVLAFGYFCSSMRTAQRTRSMGMGLITSGYFTLCLSLYYVIGDIIEAIQIGAYDHVRFSFDLITFTLNFDVYITAFFGVIGLGISALGGLLGRSRARRVHKRETQTAPSRVLV